MKREKSIEPYNPESLLFSDLYKFSMQWAVIKLFSNVKVKYRFVDRNNTIYPKGFDTELRKVIDTYRYRKLSKIRRMEFEKACPYLPSVYFDFLEGYRYDPSEVGAMLVDGHLHITIDGYWYRTILWEVPLMASICDLYYKMTGQVVDVNTHSIIESHAEKANWFKMMNVPVVDFGTRRAYSPENQYNMIKTFEKYAGDMFMGSSNVEISLAEGYIPKGTYAHEYIQGNACLYGYAHANKMAMENWVSVYNGNLGIALSDTFTTDAFLLDFDTKYANLFNGVRHDSGDSLEFTDKVIDHYKKIGIDPTTKTIIYSDGLNLDEIKRIDSYRKGEIRKSYGVGTFLTNNIPNIKPMNIVIKLVEVNGLPAVKISDTPTKAIGDEETIKFVKWQINQLLKK